VVASVPPPELEPPPLLPELDPLSVPPELEAVLVSPLPSRIPEPELLELEVEEPELPDPLEPLLPLLDPELLPLPVPSSVDPSSPGVLAPPLLELLHPWTAAHASTTDSAPPAKTHLARIREPPSGERARVHQPHSPRRPKGAGERPQWAR
jgi:hypothetical protein